MQQLESEANGVKLEHPHDSPTGTWPNTAPRLMVVTLGGVARAARAVAGQAVEWCYFGTDLLQRAAVAKALPGVPWFPVGDELTRVAADMKQLFLDWIDDIGRHQTNPVNWWASTFASSSPLQTDLLLLFSYTRLVQEWLRTDHEGPMRLVIVEDPWLALTLRRHLARRPRVTWCGSSLGTCLQDAVSWLVRIPRVLAATLVSAIGSFLTVRRLFRGAGDGVEHAPQGATLIYTWIQPSCFSTPGTLTDRWTGRLKELLSSRGKCVTRLSPASLRPSLLHQLKPFADQCIVTPRYLTLPHIMQAVCGWFRLQDLPRLAQCGGLDYRFLLYRELLREWGRADFGHYRLGYAAMRQVARRHGHRVHAIVYPFENQPWEKLLCLAWRQEAPHVKLIGYQHAWVPSLLLPYSLATGQSERAPLPDLIVTNSAFNFACLTAGGYPPSRLANGGALRYEYLHAASWSAVSDGRPPAEAERTTRSVLVTFPISLAHASSLFVELLSEFRRPLLINQEPVRVVLKCHPVLPVERLSKDPVTLPPWLTLSHAPLGQLLPNVDLLLYVGPTSSWWEARLHGVPVLKYLTDFMDMDAGASVDGMQVHHCAQGTLRTSIEALLRDRPMRRRADHRLVEQMFGKVDEELWVSVT